MNLSSLHIMTSLSMNIIPFTYYDLFYELPPCSTALPSPSGMGFLSCGEDGSLIVGEGSVIVQNIPHPCSLWCAVALPSTGSGIEGSTGWADFVTGGHDGVLRCDEEHEKL